MGPQLACGHVLDHALTQRADGGIGTHGELLLSEVVDTSIFPQDGAPHPTTVSFRLATQPSIGHPAQRLSRQRFRAMARVRKSRQRNNFGSYPGHKRHDVCTAVAPAYDPLLTFAARACRNAAI